MNGTIAQIAALTCHLNARLRGIATDQFFPGNSTCKFCEYMRFWRKAYGVAARTPDEWFDAQLHAGFRRASLTHGSTDQPQAPDRMTAGFVGGGGRWALCVEGATGLDRWEAEWQVGDRNAKDHCIWRVQYSLTAHDVPPRVRRENVEELAKELNEVLTGIEAFARERNLGGFADCFAKGLQCLISDNPSALAYQRDIAPPGVLTLPAERLLACCQVAWVFGGMGSWNDLIIEEDRYHQLSDGLFTLLNRSICAAVNDSANS